MLYIMRHGTTIWNEKHIIQGHSNNRLSKKGIELVKQSAETFKNTKIDIIYTSPLMRTVQTANIMNKFHNVKIIKDGRLIEIDEGCFTGKVKSELTSQELFVQNRKLSGYGIESWQSVHNRMKQFVDDITKNCKNKNILIVTHDLPATCLENILLNKKVDYSQDVVYSKNFDNAEIREYA